MLEQKDIEIDGKSFVISKFSAVAGREIVTQYPLSATPKLGDYQTNKDIMFKILAHVAVRSQANTLTWLKTEDLVNNHIASWETLMKVEYACMEYNCSFLADGKISNYLGSMVEKLPDWILKIATPLLASLSATEKPRSKNSKKNTA